MGYGKIGRMNKTTLYLPGDTHLRLRELARRSGRPQAELVREALERYLAQAHTPIPQSIGAGDDDQLNGRDSEDWLRTHWRHE